jgi:hypothetical protein
MTENVETEVTLPVEMADTETQLLDNLLKSIYTEMKFDIIRKSKRNIENEAHYFKAHNIKAHIFSQLDNT